MVRHEARTFVTSVRIAALAPMFSSPENARSYMKKYRSIPENRERQNVSANDSHKRSREAAQEQINQYKLKLGCIVCGFKEAAVALELHHRNPEEKSFEIATQLGRLKMEAIWKEVTKCDVICANHHRIHHARLVHR